MHVKDVIYDGQKFSDHGLLTTFISQQEEITPDIGNKLEFTKVKAANSNVFHMVNAQYQDVLQFQFEVSKLNCEHINDYVLSGAEMNDILFWLNRKETHKFQLMTDENDFNDIYYLGSFTELKPILIGESPVGFLCTFTCDAPYGYYEAVRISNYYVMSTDNGTILRDDDGNPKRGTSKDLVYSDTSKEEGVIYCDCTVKIKEDGDFILSNVYDTSNTVRVKNCKSGEILTFTGSKNIKNLTSSLGDVHKKLYNDFNFKYPRIINTYDNHLNHFISSIDAEITMEYTPIAKVGEVF